MENIFSDLARRIEGTIPEAAALAADAGVPSSTFEPILTGVNQRAGILGAR